MNTTSTATIDDVDRSIIELLQHDGRMAFTKIAANVGLTEGAIRQRVQRLTDAGVIQVVAVTDPLSLGIRRLAMIGVRVRGDLERTATELAHHSEVEYLIATAGRYDLMMEVLVEGDDHLLQFLSALRLRNDVAEAESFVCLKLFKQTFTWGAR